MKSLLPGFTRDHSWTDFLGDKIIYQLPDEMTIPQEITMDKKPGFTYLMLFTGYNREALLLMASLFQETAASVADA